MNKTTKMLAVFLTAGLLLAGCAQKESTKSTSPSSTKATSKATSKSSAKEKTKESSTDESKKEDALAGAQKTVLETSDEAGKYKDGIFYIRNTIDYTKIDFNKLKEIVPGFNPLDDKTVSYSVTKDSLIKGGMVEK